MIKEEKWNSGTELLGFSLGNYPNKDRPYLNAPRGIAVDERKYIMYVCDMFDKNIHVFNMEGRHITSFGKNFLGKPWGILLYGDVLFVTDVERQSVVKFRDFVHEEVKSIPKLLKYPRGMSIANKTNELLVTDEDNNRIIVCFTDPLQYSRVFAENIPKPYDVCICDETDIVYVLNSCDPYVFKYSLSGELLAKLSLIIGEIRPWFFCFSHQLGIFILSDYKTCKVRIFDQEMRMLEQIDQFNNPVFGVALTSDLKLIVGSYDEHRIRIFLLKH